MKFIDEATLTMTFDVQYHWKALKRHLAERGYVIIKLQVKKMPKAKIEIVD